jgi:hypothetical protein
MPEWAQIVLVFVGYIFLVKWLLPRMGVPT